MEALEANSKLPRGCFMEALEANSKLPRGCFRKALNRPIRSCPGAASERLTVDLFEAALGLLLMHNNDGGDDCAGGRLGYLSFRWVIKASLGGSY